MKMRILAAIAISLLATENVSAAVATVVIPELTNASGFQFFGSGDASVTYGGITFAQQGAKSNGNFYNISAKYSGSPSVVSSQRGSTGMPNILISLPSFARSATVTFGTLSGKNVRFTLSNGFTIVAPSSGNAYNSTDVFDTGLQGHIKTIEVTSAVALGVEAGINIRSISYETAATIPEPANWALLIAGFGFVGSAARRRIRARSGNMRRPLSKDSSPLQYASLGLCQSKCTDC